MLALNVFSLTREVFMSIDWSTAPEGAEFYAGKRFCKVYAEDVFYYKPGFFWAESPFSYEDCKKFKDYQPRPKEWPSESRIDIIGTNGNTGEAYSVTKSATDYLSQGMKILSERGKEYGATSEERSFPQVAQAFAAITGRQLSGSDVCLILNLVKKVRQYAQPNRLHEDSLVDAVNYDALWCQELAKELSE